MTSHDASANDAVTIRPLAGPHELDLFLRLSYVLDHELADDLAAGRRRPEWMWLALRGEQVLARIAWWASADSDAPQSLDFFDVDDALPGPERADVARRLLETAAAQVVPAGTTPPEYGRFVPPDWREDPAAREVVETRTNAIEAGGGRLLVERLRLEWRPGTPLAEPTNRLVFRQVRDREDLLVLMEQVVSGSLDAHTVSEQESGYSARRSAEEHYDEELGLFTSPREWWRIAELPGTGEPVGFVVPARNNYNPIIAYLGVVPAHRGHGYIDDILAEGTRILAAEDVPRIRAATDLGNVPMAKAFARAGYVNFERALNYVW
ncbi:GNAT family N-acetyltransferase [Streptomyces sp. NPDC001941]|uniref:GNAT family N-acetyltransferase n=1 Tax=Streptomyces sp. NPDC001941 TaxID=3154659 RepID=UPI00332158DA